MNRPRWWGTVGIARRAGKIVWGQEPVKAEIRRGARGLLLVAKDASHRTADSITLLSRETGVPLIRVADKETLGTAAGLPPVAVLMVTDAGLAERISASIEAE